MGTDPERRKEPLVHGIAPSLDARTLALASAREEAGVSHRHALVRRALILADVIGLVLAFLVAQGVTALFAEGGPDRVSPATEYLLLLLTLPGWLVLGSIYGLHGGDGERADNNTADELVAILHLVTVGAWLVFVGTILTDLPDPFLLKLITFWGVAVVFIPLARVASRSFVRRRITYLQNAVIVGAGTVGHTVARKVLTHPEWGINLVGFIDANPRNAPEDLAHLAVLGPPERTAEIARTLDVERVIIAFSSERDGKTIELVRALNRLDVQVDIVPRLFELLGPRITVHNAEGITFVGLPRLKTTLASRLVKRSLDVALSLVALMALAPLLIALAVSIRLESPGSVLYRGGRMGMNGRSFRLFKFRTMYTEFCRGESYGGDRAEAAFQDILSDPAAREEFERTHKLTVDPRVTSLGRFLRRTSLDELPQLLNVLLGDLSLVGPRPITMDEFEAFERSEPEPVAEGGNILRYWQIEGLRPGVTGYWQITGRSESTYAERLRLDLAYWSSWSLGVDLLIMVKTVRVLLSSRGAY